MPPPREPDPDTELLQAGSPTDVFGETVAPPAPYPALRDFSDELGDFTDAVGSTTDAPWPVVGWAVWGSIATSFQHLYDVRNTKGPHGLSIGIAAIAESTGGKSAAWKAAMRGPARARSQLIAAYKEDEERWQDATAKDRKAEGLTKPKLSPVFVGNTTTQGVQRFLDEAPHPAISLSSDEAKGQLTNHSSRHDEKGAFESLINSGWSGGNIDRMKAGESTFNTPVDSRLTFHWAIQPDPGIAYFTNPSQLTGIASRFLLSLNHELPELGVVTDEEQLRADAALDETADILARAIRMAPDVDDRTGRVIRNVILCEPDAFEFLHETQRRWFGRATNLSEADGPTAIVYALRRAHENLCRLSALAHIYTEVASGRHEIGRGAPAPMTRATLEAGAMFVEWYLDELKRIHSIGSMELINECAQRVIDSVRRKPPKDTFERWSEASKRGGKTRGNVELAIKVFEAMEDHRLIKVVTENKGKRVIYAPALLEGS